MQHVISLMDYRFKPLDVFVNQITCESQETSKGTWGG